MADKFFDAMFTASVIGGSSGPAPVIVSKNVTANGTYSAVDDQADGYNPVVVDVPNTYTAADEGKVVSGGALVAQTAYPSAITENGTYNTTENNSVTVDVPTSNYLIIPCVYDSHITDTAYAKGPTQLIIDTVNKTVELMVNFNNKTSFAQVSPDYIVLTPTIQLSEIFDSQTVFTMNYQALGTKQSTSGGGTYNNSVYPVSTNPYFTIDITNNTISIRSGMNIYGGLTVCIKWTYQ